MTAKHDEFQVIPADKVQSYLRLGLDGAGGTGKTYTALNIAQHLGSNIVVIDTERGRASKYARDFSFSVVNLPPPFTPERYTAALQAALNAGADVVVVDTFSHVWAGPGGVLEIVDTKTQASTNKNAFTSGWSDATPRLNKMVDAYLQAPVHLIFTLRVKTHYELQTNRNGRLEPVKVGLAPIIRDGFDYDMDVMGRMSTDHTLTITKTMCPLLEMDTRHPMPGHEFAETLLSWLNDGAPRSFLIPQGALPSSTPSTSPSERLVPGSQSNGNGSNRRISKVSRYQHDKLVELYQDIYAVDPDTAETGVDAMFTQQFGHGLDEASYNEGAHITARLLAQQRQGANKPAAAVGQ